MQPPKFVTTMIMGIGKFYSDGRREVAFKNPDPQHRENVRHYKTF